MLGNIWQYWKISQCSLQTLSDNTYEGLRIGQNMTNIGWYSAIFDKIWQYYEIPNNICQNMEKYPNVPYGHQLTRPKKVWK